MTNKKSILIDNELHEKLINFATIHGFKIKAVTETALTIYIETFNKKSLENTDE